MKRFYYLLLLAIVGACTTEKTMTINGTIANGTPGDQVRLITPYFDKTDTLCTITEEGTFSATIPVDSEHFGLLQVGTLLFNIYCKPGASLNFELDQEKIKQKDPSGFVLTGKYSESAQVLYDIRKIQGSSNMMSLIKMDHQEFTEAIENRASQIEKLIIDYQELFQKDISFISELRLSNEVSKASACDTYTKYHKRYAPKDSLPIPEEIANYGKEIPLDTYESFKENKDYKRFVVTSTLGKIAESIQTKSLKQDSKEYTNEMFDELKTYDTFQEVKDEIINNLLSSYTYSSDESKEVIKERYKESLKKEEYINEFESTLAKLEKLEPGNPSPTFNYGDIEGNKTSLDNLKGKLVYIDVWATWCGPCKGEIPHLKKLEEEFHGKDIEFVSISVDTDKKEWIKMVVDRELKGIQLFADNAWDSEFVQNYAIRGIPRFILLDKEGNIINSNATRPSNPKTKEQILSLLD